jgi:hypothetical protein
MKVKENDELGIYAKNCCVLVEVSQRFIIGLDNSRSLWFHALFCVGVKRWSRWRLYVNSVDIWELGAKEGRNCHTNNWSNERPWGARACSIVDCWEMNCLTLFVRDYLCDLGVDGRTILKWKQDLRLWMSFIWFASRFGVGLLRTR